MTNSISPVTSQIPIFRLEEILVNVSTSFVRLFLNTSHHKAVPSEGTRYRTETETKINIIIQANQITRRFPYLFFNYDSFDKQFSQSNLQLGEFESYRTTKGYNRNRVDDFFFYLEKKRSSTLILLYPLVQLYISIACGYNICTIAPVLLLPNGWNNNIIRGCQFSVATQFWNFKQ